MNNLADGIDGFPILPVLLAARWLHFASVFVLFGAPFFWLFLKGELSLARRGTDRLLRVSAVVAALSGLLWLAGIVANMAEGFDKIFDSEVLETFFFETQFGPVVALRLALLAACIVAAIAPLRSPSRFAALGGIGGALLINQAWLGHAAEGAGLTGALMIFAYSVHVLAAAAWLGSLPALFFVLRELRGNPEDTAEVLSSYSLMAMFAVAAIIVAGVANAGFHHGFSAIDPFASSYGRTHAFKVLLVAVMLAFAAFNRLVATPALRAGNVAMSARLCASVAAEMAIGLAVLAAAAVLGVTPPPPL